MRLDRFKVRQRMNECQIEHYKELAVLAQLNENTVYNALDSYNWRAITVDSIAKALRCSPLELITVDEEPARH